MSIEIINRDHKTFPKGPHRYEIMIKDQSKGSFWHYPKNGLIGCLQAAVNHLQQESRIKRTQGK